MPTTKLSLTQDSTKTNLLLKTDQNVPIGTINIPRKTVLTNEIKIDSNRIAPKPKVVKPIVKTIPYVPLNDTLEAPVFNTFTGEFELPQKTKGWDRFTFSVIKPTKNEKANTKKINTSQPKIETSSLKITESNILTHTTANQQGFERTDWMLGIIVISLILFSWINVKFSKFVNAVVVSSYNFFSARRLQEESNVVRNNIFIAMNILFFINTALLITQVFDFNNIKVFEQSGIVLFLMFFAAIIGVYSIKSLFLVILDFIFLTRGGFLSYNTTIYLYNKLYGFMLLPLIIIIPFVPQNISVFVQFLSLILFGILYLMRLLRGIQLGFKNRLSILYLILYLCALEILPLLLIYHTIKMYI